MAGRGKYGGSVPHVPRDYEFGSDAETPPAVINVTRQRIARARMSGPGPGSAWHWHHYAVGPDGTRFDNRSVVELRSVLRRRYGRGVQIIEAWKGA